MDPTEEPSLVDTIAQFRSQGYGGDFTIKDGALRCPSCGRSHRANAAVIVDVARFEGVSDPDDEAALFGLRCPHCGALGVLVTAYGPTVDADTEAVLSELQR